MVVTNQFQWKRRQALRSIGAGGAAMALQAAGVWAQPTQQPIQPVKAVVLLPADMALRLDTIIPPPPGPVVDVQEAAYLVTLKRLRTPQRLVQIELEAGDPTPLFWQVAGLPVTPERNNLLLAIQTDVVMVTLDLKARYERRRPSTVDARIEPAVPVPWHSSYPSGHATQSRVMAHLFSQWVPGARNALFVLADRIAVNREVAGLHYPSDTREGKALADRLWELFLPFVR